MSGRDKKNTTGPGSQGNNMVVLRGPHFYNTESFIYYARQQTAVAHGLAWPSRRFTVRQPAAARKHSLCFLVLFPSNCHAQRRTFALLIVIIVRH